MAILEVTAELVGEGSQSVQAGVSFHASSELVGEGSQSVQAGVSFHASSMMTGTSSQDSRAGFLQQSVAELVGDSIQVGTSTVRYWIGHVTWDAGSVLTVDPAQVVVNRFGRGPKVPVPQPKIPKVKAIPTAPAAQYVISLRARRGSR